MDEESGRKQLLLATGLRGDRAYLFSFDLDRVRVGRPCARELETDRTEIFVSFSARTPPPSPRWTPSVYLVHRGGRSVPNFAREEKPDGVEMRTKTRQNVRSFPLLCGIKTVATSRAHDQTHPTCHSLFKSTSDIQRVGGLIS